MLMLIAAIGGCGGGSGGGVVAPPALAVQPFLSNVNFAVALAMAPDGRLFYNELRTGNVRIVQNGRLLSQPFATLPVFAQSDQGLLGIALDPDFGANHFVYLYHTVSGPLRGRLVRFTDNNNSGTNLTVLVDNLPAGNIHNAGRIVFGRDGSLFLSTGDNATSISDTASAANSQSMATLAGKILRYNKSGSIPADNMLPNSPIYALGFRNPFGMALYPTTGALYVSENGPFCNDELDRVVKGGNYGWRPDQTCTDSDPRFVAPLATFNPTIAPTGMAFYTGNALPEFRNQLFMASFKDGAVRRFLLDEGNGGRLIAQATVVAVPGAADVIQGNDGLLYVGTQNSIVRLVRAP